MTQISESKKYAVMENLREIDVSGSQATTVPSSWSLAPSLKVLKMQGSSVTNIPWKIATYPHIEIFDVTSSPCSRAIDWSGVVDEQSLNPNITAQVQFTVESLDLSYNGLSFVPGWVKGFLHLKTLDFSSNDMTIFNISSIEGGLDSITLKGNPIHHADLSVKSPGEKERQGETKGCSNCCQLQNHCAGLKLVSLKSSCGIFQSSPC